MCGNAKELADVGGKPGKSDLFFFTAETTLESGEPERGLSSWESTTVLWCPVPFRRPLKMRGTD